MKPQQFIDTIAALAVSEMRRTGILASITIAQGALESGWGVHAPGNNLFGIKGAGQLRETQEVVNGHWIRVIDGFRVYDDWIGSLIDHSQFLIENSRYAKAGFFEYCANRDYKSAARSLQQAGYATDPDYAAKLISIIQKYSLDLYDKEAETAMLAKDDANKIIGFLKAAYEASASKEAKDEFHRLANELRKASGQPEE